MTSSALGLLALLSVVLLIVVRERLESRATPNATELSKPLGALALVLTSAAVAGTFVAVHPAVPYNIRELLAGGRAAVAALVIAASISATGALACALAHVWRRDASTFVAWLPWTVFGAASAMFAALSLTVPLESIDDVVGTPILGLGGTLERWGRFTFLLAGPAASLTLGARFTVGALRHVSIDRGMLAACGLILASYLVVVPMAATSNIVELLRGRGYHAATLAVLGLPMALGAVMTILARALVAPAKPRALSRGLALAIAFATIPVAWQLLVAGTNPRLDKYGQVFSAVQFLFSPTRERYIPQEAAFMPFALAYLTSSVVLASGAALILSARERLVSHDSRREDTRGEQDAAERPDGTQEHLGGIGHS